MTTYAERDEKSGTRFPHGLATVLGARRTAPPVGALAVRRAVEVGLSVMGDSAMSATFFFMESNGGLERDRIPDDPDAFVTALRTIFGFGSKELMTSVLRALRDEEAALHGDKVLRGFEAVIEQGIKSVEMGVM